MEQLNIKNTFCNFLTKIALFPKYLKKIGGRLSKKKLISSVFPFKAQTNGNKLKNPGTLGNNTSVQML